MCGSKPQPSAHMVSLFGVASLRPKTTGVVSPTMGHLICINYQVFSFSGAGERVRPGIKDFAISQGQGFKGCLPGIGGENVSQPIIYLS